MKYLLLSFLFFSFTGSAQTFVNISRDTVIKKELAIILTNDSIIQAGSVLKCGRGTLPNGSFKYLHTSNANWALLMGGTQDEIARGGTPLGKGYGGLNLNVKSIQKQGSKKRGYRYYIKVGGGNIVNYQVELDDAIAVGEVIGPNVSAPAVAAATPVTNNTDPAELLKKLKNLVDQGAITQDEYDSTKKKILSRM
jgi:hypothetical protein